MATLSTSAILPRGAAHGAARAAGSIGPNAVTQMAAVLLARTSAAARYTVFERAGIEHYLALPPDAMIDERSVAALHRALVDQAGPAAAATLSWEAGQRTGDYLLANRIPKAAQRMLRWLPHALAARILVRAIAAHAWTFSGSGTFSYRFSGGALELTLAGSPICRQLKTQGPACHYFAGTFQRVFAAMLGPRVRVAETACEAAGAPACVFRVTWAGRRAEDPAAVLH
jgi:divinyl protochlorophyllide a 8-vinyl-reductase